MLSVLRNLQKSQSTLIKSVNNLLKTVESPILHQKCTFYPEFYVKKDRFDKVHKKLKADKSISLDTVRINILKHLDEKRQSVNEALFDNLKVFIYLAKDDKDLGILLRCFQTYSRVKQFQEMTISVLFIRKLVALNKLDYATDVLLNRNNSFNFMNQISSAVAVIDALMDRQRYDQVLEIFEQKFLLTGSVIPRFVFFAVSLSLLKKNDSEAFTKMEKYIDHMDKKGFHLGIGSIVHIYFLALQLGNIEYGLKFLSQTSRVHRSLYCNLLIIGLLDLNQIDAALDYCRKLLKIELKSISEYRSVDSMDGKFFRTTIDHLDKAVAQCKLESIKTEYALIAQKLDATRLIEMDIIKYFENSSVGIDRKDVRETHRF